MSIQQVQQCFNKSQQCSTFVDQQKLNDVEPCIIRLTKKCILINVRVFNPPRVGWEGREDDNASFSTISKTSASVSSGFQTREN